MRAGCIEEASACAWQVGILIEWLTKRHLHDVDPHNGFRDLWRRVGEITNHRRSDEVSVDINIHISTDAGCEQPHLKATVSDRDSIVTERNIFYLLDHLHPTTTGYDGLPAWFLRLTDPVYSGTIAHLINQSIVQTHFPSQRKTSIIIPIAKIVQPTSPADFRPIFITPVLSRLL